MGTTFSSLGPALFVVALFFFEAAQLHPCCFLIVLSGTNCRFGVCFFAGLAFPFFVKGKRPFWVENPWRRLLAALSFLLSVTRRRLLERNPPLWQRDSCKPSSLFSTDGISPNETIGRPNLILFPPSSPLAILPTPGVYFFPPASETHTWREVVLPFPENGVPFFSDRVGWFLLFFFVLHHENFTGTPP